ncbi:MAG: hypothetical protein KAU06_02160 [Candidatus Marinimicrobia bacterium]|nr:hypothetical protein [Candidatus Neomarinimicrobiota bacterium]
MKRGTYLLLSLVLIFSVAVFINGCSENSVSNPNEPVESIGIHVDDIQWIPVKTEVLEKLKSLSKTGMTGKMITPEDGGIVGGNITLDNTVEIPRRAVEEKTFVTVEVLCIEDKKQTSAGVEFLPSMEFEKDVTITLSWAFLDLEDDEELEFNIYFSEDEGYVWFPLEKTEMVIDYDEKTVKFKTDHFTRYGWGI